MRHTLYCVAALVLSAFALPSMAAVELGMAAQHAQATPHSLSAELALPAAYMATTVPAQFADTGGALAFNTNSTFSTPFTSTAGTRQNRDMPKSMRVERAYVAAVDGWPST